MRQSLAMDFSQVSDARAMNSSDAAFLLLILMLVLLWNISTFFRTFLGFRLFQLSTVPSTHSYEGVWVRTMTQPLCPGLFSMRSSKCSTI